MSRFKFVTSKIITWQAWISLFIAFLIGHFAAKTNYVQLLSHHFPDSTFSNAPEQGAGPRAFLRDHQELSEPELVLIADGQGFGGPLTVAVTVTETGSDSYINKVTLLRDRETPPFIARLTKHFFFDEFNRRGVTDDSTIIRN